MKKLLIIIGLMLFVMTAFSQRTISDTLNGNETVNFASMTWPDQVQVLCTQIGGTSDGSLKLEASVDGTSWETITETAGLIHFYPNDTLTIVDAAVWYVTIIDNPFLYCRVKGVGTASDSTLITIKWIK